MLLTAAPLAAQGPASSGTTNSVPINFYGRYDPPGGGSNYSGIVNPFGLTESPYVVTGVHDPAAELLGAALQQVGDVLRTQLDIPAGQGLLVASVRPDGPAAQAGLKQNDVLLSVGDKPLTAHADLAKHLKASGESPVPLKLLRGGKPVTLQVRPVYHVTLGPAPEEKTEYFIGVSIEPVDDAVRAQLSLPGGQGVVITDVVGGSPAEKAGVKKNDIVVALGDKAIDTPEALAREVQAAKDKPNTLKVVRGGKRIAIPVTAAVRKVENAAANDALALYALSRTYAADKLLQGQLTAQPTDVELRQRLEHLEQEMKAIRAALDQISDTLKNTKPKKPD
jgi:membrane-associated protease RseP (regulator of RpoE activity)